MKLYINTAVIGVLCLASVSASAIRNRANDKRTKEKVCISYVVHFQFLQYTKACFSTVFAVSFDELFFIEFCCFMKESHWMSIKYIL